MQAEVIACLNGLQWMRQDLPTMRNVVHVNLGQQTVEMWCTKCHGHDKPFKNATASPHQGTGSWEEITRWVPPALPTFGRCTSSSIEELFRNTDVDCHCPGPVEHSVTSCIMPYCSPKVEHKMQVPVPTHSIWRKDFST